MSKSLENVQPGDRLICNHGGSSRTRSIITVGRTTKTQVLTTHGGRYRKSTGYTVGSDIYSANQLTIPEEGEIDQVIDEQIHRRLVSRIHGACGINELKEFSLDKLRVIAAALDQS